MPEQLRRDDVAGARRPRQAAPGTVAVHALGEDVIVISPKDARDVLFGRNRPAVDVCVGEDDPTVSRVHGALTYSAGRWWLRNDGNLAIRIGESHLMFPEDGPVPLAEGYTSLVVQGRRPHPLEVLVTGAGSGRVPRHGEPTWSVRAWELDDTERLAVVVLAQAYLRNDPNPQPVSWQQAAELLAELQPDRAWTEKRVEHRVRAVRLRLAAGGVIGLRRPEVGGAGDALKHNLVRELIATHSISSRDLFLIDIDDSGHVSGG